MLAEFLEVQARLEANQLHLMAPAKIPGNIVLTEIGRLAPPNPNLRSASGHEGR